MSAEQYSDDERLTLKVWETPLGYWAYSVYSGDGTKPGSLKAAAGGCPDPDAAGQAGLNDLRRRIVIRACEHEFEPWNGDAKMEHCIKCGIVKGFSLGSEGL